MEMVFITALGVGGATLVGALIGFCFKRVSDKVSDIILGFAAGVMLSASVIGLIMPSLELGGKHSVLVSILAIFVGAYALNLIDKFVPHLHRLAGIDKQDNHESVNKFNKVLLFVMAIAIHNFPEGIAAGVGFGTGNNAEAMTIAGGIALQNIPEGMVIIAPMIASGISKRRTLTIAAITGLVEVVGTFIGYFAVSVSEAILPFALAFAGGTMLYIISDEMIPQTHSHGNEREATYSLILGFCLLLLIDFYM